MKHYPEKTSVSQIEITRLDQIKGQEGVTNKLKVHLGAHSKIFSITVDVDLPFGPVILVGPLGTGKTSVAKAIHSERHNTHWLQTNGAMLNTPRKLLTTLLNADDDTTICIDEAHKMSPKTQHILTSAISTRALPNSDGQEQTRHSVSLRNYTLILLTTHEYLLTPFLRKQIKITCRFDYYSVKDIVEIVRQRAVALGWQLDSKSIAKMIAERSKGTVKQALNVNLQMCREVSLYFGHESITIPDVYSAFNCLQIDELGLDSNDRNYLNMLAHNNHASLSTISSKLGVPSKTILELIEPYLIKENFVTVDQHSMRILTDKGVRHMMPDSPIISDYEDVGSADAIPF